MGSCASLHRNSNSDSDSAMKFRLSFRSKDDKLVIPPSPIKENPTNGNPPTHNNNNVVAAKSQWPASRSTTSFGGYGSKEETFFDSQAWLESDCEDDFLSVNGAELCKEQRMQEADMLKYKFIGPIKFVVFIDSFADFTPSRGNTPVHHNFSTGTPRVNKAHLEDRIPGSTSEPSPKKKLVELFRESNQQDLDIEDENTSGNQNISKGKIKVKQTILDLLPNSAHDTPYGTNSVCSSERTPNGDLLIEKEKPIRPVQCCLPSLISCRSFSERKKKMEPAIAVID